jgi:hypothetical protein
MSEPQMRKIRCHLSIGLVGCKRETVIEVEADLSDDDINDVVREWVDERIEWDWKPEA